MRILGSLVIRNESNRYLAACLRWMTPFLDGVFVYDDRSDDNSAAIAVSLGAQVVIRHQNNCSFLDHEGEFRANAWLEFEETLVPQHGDWVLSFDADEFLVCKSAEPEDGLRRAINRAQSESAVGVILPFPEVFGTHDESLWIRTDGFWGQVRGPRLFAYRENGVFNDKAMGCGSEPTYVSRGKLSSAPCGLSMLHFGYARPEDVASKYARYSSMTHGHSDSHIQSIPLTPRLERWDGPVPEYG